VLGAYVLERLPMCRRIVWADAFVANGLKGFCVGSVTFLRLFHEMLQTIK
jgi:hypothetical protein